jgi:hypothetical protein
VILKANGRELDPPATRIGDGVFQRVARFIGRSDPIEVYFIALDQKGERRCAGSIMLESLGRKP